jgi:hypothetical protein
MAQNRKRSGPFLFGREQLVKKFIGLLTILFSVCVLAPALRAQTAAVNGFCNQGGTHSKTSGLSSSNYLQGIVPHCTVTVYLTGTTTKATIYADAVSTPLTNPFTAGDIAPVSAGKWIFFAVIGQGYDVVLSGGDAPNTYPSPVTIVDVGQLGTGGGGGNTVTTTGPLQVNGGTGPVTGPITLGCPTCATGSTGINQLTGPVTAGPGSGSQATTITPTGVSAATYGPCADTTFLVSGQASAAATVPCPTNLEVSYTPQAAGQYVLVYAQSCTTQNTGSGAAPSCYQNAAGQYNAAVVPGSGASGVTLSNYTLPSYVNPANVTAVYAFMISTSTMLNAEFEGMWVNNTGGGTIPGGASMLQGAGGASQPALDYPLVQISVPFSILPTNYSTITMNASRCCNGLGSIEVPLMGLEVHYTGTAPPTDSNLQIQPPLIYSAASDTLGVSPNWPNLSYLTNVPALPHPSGQQSVSFVSDGQSPTDCSTGGGTYDGMVNLCYWNGSTYKGFAVGGGVPTVNSNVGSLVLNFSSGAGSCSFSGSPTPAAGLTTCTITGSSSGGGSVTNFVAGSGSWPTWLVPSVATSTTTPTLSVTAGAIPNTALANSTITINSTTCTLGSSCTVSSGSGTVTSFIASSGWPSWLVPTVTSATTTPTLTVVANAIPNASLATQTANTVLGALTATTPSGLAMPSCSTAVSALNWVTSSGFTCNTLGTFASQNFATPPAIGGTTPAAGAFSSLIDTGAAAATGLYCLQINTAGTISNAGAACGAGGGGTNVQINGAAALITGNFNNTVPSPTSGYLNVLWQNSGVSVSAEVPIATNTVAGVSRPDTTTISASSGVISAINIIGQTAGYAIEANSATTATGQFPLDDAITNAGYITAHKPIAIQGTTHGLTIPAGTQVAGLTANVVYGSDGGSTGNAMVSENAGAYSRVCLAANGACGAVIADTTITVGTTAISATCSSNSASTATMTGLTSTSTLTFTPNSDLSSVSGWNAGTLYFNAWPTANTLNYRVCTGNTGGVTPGGSTTWNVSAR